MATCSQSICKMLQCTQNSNFARPFAFDVSLPSIVPISDSIVLRKSPIVTDLTVGLTQEWFRELSFSSLECGVHDKLHISSADRWDL